MAKEEDDLVDGGPKSNKKVANPEPGTNAARRLKTFINRIEKLHEGKQEFLDDIKTVFLEAKAAGFDTKAMRKIIAERKKDATQREEEEAVLDLYKHALGMLPG